MLPDGLKYVDSWVEVNGNRCFQLMECDDVRLFEQWWRFFHKSLAAWNARKPSLRPARPTLAVKAPIVRTSAASFSLAALMALTVSSARNNGRSETMSAAMV